MLSDGTIRKLVDSGRIGITPLPFGKAFQPCSIDLRLDQEFILLDSHANPFVDPRKGTKDQTTLKQTHEFYLHPKEFALASTIEFVKLPPDIVAMVNGKSSLGRMGLLIHATAGFIDPGFQGRITLELSNVSNLPILLRSGMYICQLTFMYLDRPAERPYGSAGLGSKYQHQQFVTPSKVEPTMDES